MRLALLQLVSRGTDRQANRRAGLDACRQAKRAGADLALFPEMWSIGYTFPKQSLHDPTPKFGPDEFAAMAEPADGAWIGSYRELAAELSMAIAITYLERTTGGSRNTISVFDQQGEEVLRYAKAHLCSFHSEDSLEPGTEFPVAPLETDAGPLRIGAMICYDREFPEAARLLMLNDAELVLVPNACWIDDNRMAQLRTRSFENMFAVAMTNYGAPQHNGRSVLFDGIAVEKKGRPRDITVIEATAGPDVVIGEFDLDLLRTYRDTEVWGPNHRRPGLYGPLASPGSVR